MDSFDQTLDSIFERARATKPIMVTLGAAPYNWYWDGPSPGNYGNQIDQVDDQVALLAEFEAGTTEAASLWDSDLDTLIADAMLGTRLARSKFESLPSKFVQFENLRYRPTGRDARYKQALAFEKAWKKANPAWVFKSGLTLADFTTRREAIKDREDAHAEAIADERHERILLHILADELNAVSVRWYDVATATFAEDTAAGQLIRTIPTTYDPNRAPAQLRFTVHMSSAPNQVHLIWRAARGERFHIRAQAPGAAGFDLILDGVTDTEWIGLSMAPGQWRFQGFATNQHGQGADSEVVEISVAAAVAA